MTVYADYRCPYCGYTEEQPVASEERTSPAVDSRMPLDPMIGSHRSCPELRLYRVWSPVGIGAVPGAGGSPSR